MAEYIDREKLLRDINHYHLSDGKFQHWVEVQQAEDVAPVRHGRWIAPFLSDGGNMCAECSNCHRIRIFDDYCSACGAIMDLNDLED